MWSSKNLSMSRLQCPFSRWKKWCSLSSPGSSRSLKHAKARPRSQIRRPCRAKITSPTTTIIIITTTRRNSQIFTAIFLRRFIILDMLTNRGYSLRPHKNRNLRFPRRIPLAFSFTRSICRPRPTSGIRSIHKSNNSIRNSSSLSRHNNKRTLKDLVGCHLRFLRRKTFNSCTISILVSSSLICSSIAQMSVSIQLVCIRCRSRITCRVLLISISVVRATARIRPLRWWGNNPTCNTSTNRLTISWMRTGQIRASKRIDLTPMVRLIGAIVS